MTNQPATQLPCGCPATWSDAEGQYVGNCQCDPEAQRNRFLAQQQAIIQSHQESQARNEAPLYRRPFSILR